MSTRYEILDMQHGSRQRIGLVEFVGQYSPADLRQRVVAGQVLFCAPRESVSAEAPAPESMELPPPRARRGKRG
jgi:hypothetical protein